MLYQEEFWRFSGFFSFFFGVLSATPSPSLDADDDADDADDAGGSLGVRSPLLTGCVIGFY